MRTQQAPEEKLRTPRSIHAGGKTDEQRSSLGLEGLLAPVQAPEEKPCLKLLSSGRPSFKDQCHRCHNAFFNPANGSPPCAQRSAPLSECSLGSRLHRVNCLHSGPPHRRARAPAAHTLRPLTVS